METLQQIIDRYEAQLLDYQQSEVSGWFWIRVYFAAVLALLFLSIIIFALILS